MDKMKDGSQQLKFLVFDVLIVDRKNLMRRSLGTRLGVLAQAKWTGADFSISWNGF